jgi:SpoVK/Ycf46/Vps4 family AAA+-type ATPase
MPVLMTTAETREIKNADLFKTEFKQNSNAAIGVYAIRTRELVRAASCIQDISVEKTVQFLMWTCNKGWQRFPDPSAGLTDGIDIAKPVGGPIERTIDVHMALEFAIKETAPAIFVLHHLHFHFDKAMIQQDIRDFVAKAREHDHRLVFLVPENVKIPIELEDDIHVMDFRPPSHAELLDCYQQTMDSIEDSAQPDFDAGQIDTIVQNAVGMTINEFETALALGIVETQNVIETREDGEQHPDDYIKVVLKHKTEAIKKTDILELMQPRNMSDVGGLDLLKAWLKKRVNAYSPEAKGYGVEVPRGFMCVGPPGGGKSLVAKATASTLLVPLVKFDIGKIFGKFIGESEGRMRQALVMIESMAPCVLLLDEVDKAFGGMNGAAGDGGVGMRVFGSFLSWMQDRDSEKYPVFVVMTANNVTGLPPELMRKGRLDEIFAVTFPSVEEREEIIKIHLKNRGHENSLSGEDINAIAMATDHFVGAELEELVKTGLLESFNLKQKKPGVKVFLDEAKAIRPLHDAFPDRVQAMHEWAKNNAKPASSGMHFDGVAPPKTLPVKAGALPGARRINMPAKPSKGKGLDG